VHHQFDHKVNQSYQKHQHRDLVDRVHGAEVEVGFAVGVVLAEEVGGYFAKIKESLHVRV
jgi:hypothetical protein